MSEPTGVSQAPRTPEQPLPTGNPVAQNGVGSRPVKPAGIAALVAYLAALSVLLLYLLVALWPVPTPARTATPAQGPAPQEATAVKQTEPAEVILFGRSWEIWDEERLLILVIAAGALGSLVHALRSLYWYVGNRNLVLSWVPKYLLLPFCGATLAVLFYFVVRGGFFSPEAGFKETSPFGFCALASLVGLFSEQAVLKLKQVAETVFTKPEAGEDAKPPATLANPKPLADTAKPPSPPIIQS